MTRFAGIAREGWEGELRKPGITSGIVIDNQVSSGGTNIYFSTLAPGSVNGQNCQVTGGLANPYCAVKLTQSALP